MSLQLGVKMKATMCPDGDMECRLAQVASGGAAAIDARLEAIESEWSAGRVAKAFLALAILAGTILTASVNEWWIVLPVVAGLFLLQYLFTHDSILVRMVRGLGFRTRSVIEQEKFALRTLRGDFRTLPTILDIEDTDDISRLEGEGGLVIEDEVRKVDSKEAVKEVLEASKPH
jgi:hypothetical protein